MSARNELHDIIADAYEDKNYGHLSLAAADAILAAGYSKPRTITATEELPSLNEGAVLMSGDRIKRYAGAIWRVSGGMVVRVGRELDGVTPFTYFVDPLPATVLHEGAQA